jgi:protein involved in polysaccharide export with SLBB domain
MLQLILEFIVRAALIAGVTAAVLRFMKVRTAAVRHAVWTRVVVVMLLLPVWLTWGPKAYLRVLPNATHQPAVVAIAPRMLVNLTRMPPAQASPSGTHPAPRWPKLALGFYLLGVGVLLARLTIGTARAHTLARRAVNRAGSLTSASCAAPVTVGWLHPVVILPEQWLQWSPAQIDAVWTHELAHARRRDPLVQWLALFNRAVFWFHPIAWWLERELSALAEEACDAAVLESGHDPREYSECLLHMARSVLEAGARINVGMAMPGSFLPQRIHKILEGGPVPRVSRARMACAVTVCAVMSAALAAGTLAYAPQRDSLPRGPEREFDSGSFNPPGVLVLETKPKAVSMFRRPGQTGPPVLLAQSQSAPAAQVPPDTGRRSDAPDYTLGPHDQVLIRAPQVELIDGHPFRIDADGNINLPLLGLIHVGGMTLRELEGDLVQRLRAYVREPQVFITVVQTQSGPVARVPDAPDYRLEPIDQVVVHAPQAAEIDGHPFRIDAGGNINLPLLGRVHAGGMTVRELEGDLVQRLREHVGEPQVLITVVQFHAPPPVYFVGAFKAPGSYPLQGSRKLAEMLTAAGGLGPDAGRYITVTRQAMYGPVVEIRVDRLREPLNPEEDILLQPLDVVSVEPDADRPAIH